MTDISACQGLVQGIAAFLFKMQLVARW